MGGARNYTTHTHTHTHAHTYTCTRLLRKAKAKNNERRKAELSEKAKNIRAEKPARECHWVGLKSLLHLIGRHSTSLTICEAPRLRTAPAGAGRTSASRLQGAPFPGAQARRSLAGKAKRAFATRHTAPEHGRDVCSTGWSAAHSPSS